MNRPKYEFNEITRNMLFVPIFFSFSIPQLPSRDVAGPRWTWVYKKRCEIGKEEAISNKFVPVIFER